MNKLPETPEEWADIPRPVSLPPDATDLYHSSHKSLPKCPFCGRHPIVMGEINEQTGIIGYRVECDIIRCGASVFANGKNRNDVRNEAIRRWSQRI